MDGVLGRISLDVVRQGFSGYTSATDRYPITYLTVTTRVADNADYNAATQTQWPELGLEVDDYSK